MIRDISKASSVRAVLGISVNPLPLPLKKPLPVGIVMLPLTYNCPLLTPTVPWIPTYEPVSSTPKNAASIKNPLSPSAEAVTNPSETRFVSNDIMFCNLLPSPSKKAADIICDWIDVDTNKDWET